VYEYSVASSYIHAEARQIMYISPTMMSTNFICI